MKIVVLGGCVVNPGDLSWDLLRQFGDLTVYDRTSPHDLEKRIYDADIILAGKTIWNETALDYAPKLKLLTLLSTGYNEVDLSECEKRGITVCNVPSYSTASVAQMTYALLLELCMHASDHSRGVFSGRWTQCLDFCYWESPLVELEGKTIGIIGLGDIGKRVANIALAFGLHVLYTNRSMIPADAASQCVLTPFEELLENSDIVSLHCPSTPETKNLINEDAISRMRNGAFLINTARGSLVNEHDLVRALNSGKLGGAGLDVVSEEPMRSDSPLLGAKNLILTPHIAWATKEARERLLSATFNNVRSFIEGNPINVVKRPL